MENAVQSVRNTERRGGCGGMNIGGMGGIIPGGGGKAPGGGGKNPGGGSGP